MIATPEKSIMTQVRAITRKYGAVTMVNFQNQIAYVWDALSRSVFIILIMFVFSKLWGAVYANQGAAAIEGLSLNDTIWYFLIAEMMELGRVRHDTAISAEVKDGSIAYTLIRPYNYLAFHFFNGLAELAIKMSLILLLGIPIVVWQVGWPTISAWHILPAALAAAMAVIIDFLIFSLIGLLAFVTEDTQSFRLIYQKLVFILGGLLIPLDFLPQWLQRIARVLPFNLTTYAPAKLFVRFEAGYFWEVIGLQTLWIAIFGVALFFQYRWASKRLSINGG